MAHKQSTCGRQFSQVVEYYTIELFIDGINEPEETLEPTYDSLEKARAALELLTPPPIREYLEDPDPYERWRIGYRICKNTVAIHQVGWPKWGEALPAKKGRRPKESPEYISQH